MGPSREGMVRCKVIAPVCHGPRALLTRLLGPLCGRATRQSSFRWPTARLEDPNRSARHAHAHPQEALFTARYPTYVRGPRDNNNLFRAAGSPLFPR